MSCDYCVSPHLSRHLYQFELYEKNKAKGGGAGSSKRFKPHPPPSSDEEQDDVKQQDTPHQQDRTRQQDRLKRLKQQDTSGDEKSGHVGSGKGPGGATPPGEKVNGLDRGRKVLMSEQKTIKTIKIEKLAVRQQPPPVKLEEEEEERASDSKSESSDMECSSAPVSEHVSKHRRFASPQAW